LLTLAAVALDKPHRVPLDVLRWVVGPPVSAVACDFVFEPGPEHFGPDAHAFFVWSPVVWNVRARFSLSFFFFPLFGGVRDTSRDRPETVPGHIGTRCSALPLRIFCSPRTLAVALISRRRGLERPLRFGWQWRLAGCRRPNADRDQDNVHDIADLRSERHRSAFKRVRQKSQVGTVGDQRARRVTGPARALADTRCVRFCAGTFQGTAPTQPRSLAETPQEPDVLRSRCVRFCVALVPALFPDFRFVRDVREAVKSLFSGRFWWLGRQDSNLGMAESKSDF
jgi:hypothetical protein